MTRARLLSPALLLALALGTPGCSESPAASASAATSPAAAPAAIEIAPGQKDLVLRYLDPGTGEVATAASLDAVPEPARREVVVYDPTREPPPGWDYVADLSRGLPATATPRQSFTFQTRAAAAPVARPEPTATAAGPREVVLFSTQGCGYCSKARKFLTANRIPFTELDVEEDPQAPARLTALGQKAGLGPRDLQGVPILFIDGKPMVGWDEKRVAGLLGLKG